MQKKCKKFAIWHHRITYSGYILATKARTDNRKKLVKQQCLPHTFSQYGELQPTGASDRFISLGHPSKFQQVSHLGFVTAATSLNGSEPNFALCLAISWAGTLYIHIFGGSCPVMEFCQVQNSLCVQVLHFPILAALLHGTQVVGVSHFAALSRERHYIFDRVAITLGIASHCSLCFYSKKAGSI